MFIAGIIKYAERTCSLWFANRKKSEKSHANEVQYTDIVARVEGIPGTKWLLVAYFWYEALIPHLENYINKIHAVGLSKISFDFKDENGVENIFKVIEIELGLVYDEVYSKAALIYTGASCILRAVSFICTVTVLAGFSVISKVAYSNVDVVITYVLFIAAVVLEVYAFILMICSDWGVIWIVKHCKGPIVTQILRVLAFLKANQKRWSSSVAQFNLLDFCELKSNIIDRILALFGKEEEFKKYRCQYNVHIDKHLDWKKLTLEGAGKILAQIDDIWKFPMRGELTLQGYEVLQDLGWVFEKGFDEFIICWHVATDICCYESKSKGLMFPQKYSHLKKAIFLSHYMMFLRVKQPHMLRISAGNITFKRTCDELKKICKSKGQSEQITEAIRRTTNGEGVLVNACKLADFMLQTYPDDLWEIIGDVWMEMMCYGAAHCQVNHHVEQLRQGGEWLTHVWLLLTILGLTDKVNVKAERAKLRSESRERIAPLVDYIFPHFTFGGSSSGYQV